MRVYLSFVIIMMTVSGCQSGGDHDATINWNVICPVDGCEPGELLDIFSQWSEEALYYPDSAMVVYRLGHTREEVAVAASICVPERWSGSVNAAKANFIRLGRELLSAENVSTEESRMPRNCSPPPSGATDRIILSRQIPGRVLPEGDNEDSEPLHLAVVCDLSTSTRDIACNHTSLGMAYSSWMDLATAAGSTLTIYVVGTTRDTARRLISVSMPETGTPSWITAYLLSAVNEVADLQLESTEESGSAIAETVEFAVANLRERIGVRSLLILSDLRQITDRRMNFEQEIPDADDFQNWLSGRELPGNFEQISVTVCGVHHLRSGDQFNAHQANLIRSVWMEAFRQAGAVEVEIYSECETAFSGS